MPDFSPPDDYNFYNPDARYLPIMKKFLIRKSGYIKYLVMAWRRCNCFNGLFLIMSPYLITRSRQSTLFKRLSSLAWLRYLLYKRAIFLRGSCQTIPNRGQFCGLCLIDDERGDEAVRDSNSDCPLLTEMVTYIRPRARLMANPESLVYAKPEIGHGDPLSSR